MPCHLLMLDRLGCHAEAMARRVSASTSRTRILSCMRHHALASTSSSCTIFDLRSPSGLHGAHKTLLSSRPNFCTKDMISPQQKQVYTCTVTREDLNKPCMMTGSGGGLGAACTIELRLKGMKGIYLEHLASDLCACAGEARVPGSLQM